MACRNCGDATGTLYDVVLAGDRRVTVTLCAACCDDYREFGWIREATERE